jgi:hypothetical protein
MQHRKLLELVENDIASMDRDYLNRTRLLLKSDLWLANSRLYDLKGVEPDRIFELEAERDRINMAIEKIDNISPQQQG